MKYVLLVVAAVLIFHSTGATVHAAPPAITTAAITNMQTGVPVNVSLDAVGGTQPYTWTLIGGAFPSGVSLDPAGGAIHGTPSLTGNYGVVIQVTDFDGLTATATYTFQVIAPLQITSSTLKSGDVGLGYSETLTAAGGYGGYSWSATNLPPGLMLNVSNGSISGSPTASGAFTMDVTVTDAGGLSVSRQFTLLISSPISGVSIVPGVPLSINAGEAIGFQLYAFGGTPPFTWQSSNLSAGLTLSGNTVSGIPTTLGANNINFTVSDGTGKSMNFPISFTVVSKVIIATTNLKPWTAGQAGYSDILTASGGLGSLTWSLSSGSLPAGLTLSASGTLTGTPTSAGVYSFTVTASDTSSPALSSSKTFSLKVSPPVSGLTQSIPDGVMGSPYSTTLTAANGTPPYSWSITAGLNNLSNLGLFLDGQTGVLSGTPVVPAATVAFTATVTDAAGSAVILPLSMNVVSSLAIATSSLPSGDKGSIYAQTLAASGGTPPYAWSILSGTLPDGVSLGAATGTISGTPMTAGSFTFVVSVTDNAGRNQLKTLSIAVNPSAIADPPKTATSVIFDPANLLKLYVGIDNAGIYFSSDGGATWIAATTQPTNNRVKALVLKPGDSATLFAATYGGGVFTSSTSALTWGVCTNTGLTNLNLVSLTIDGTGKLYAGTEAGVFVSTDNCTSWTAMNSGLPN